VREEAEVAGLGRAPATARARGSIRASAAFVTALGLANPGVVGCGLAGLGLAGCGSLLQSKSPPASVYLLSAAAATPGAAVAADLQIRKPRVRTGLNTDRIVALYSDRHLDYFAGAMWSGPVDEVVMDLALQSFRTGANLRSVVDAEASAAGSYWLDIEVLDFQAEYDTAAAPTVHVRFLARLGDSSGHVLGRFEAAERRTATDNRLSAIVEAYDQSAGAALAQIVSQCTARLALAASRVDPG
jgi:ABC-type uncharacterized transport system auxiliary subunit